MSKTLFISDLDGTLLNSKSRLSSESISLLNKAISEGALFSIATARTPSTVSTLMENINTDIPFIVMTGAAIWNPANGRFIHKVTMMPEDAAQILKVLKEDSLPSFIYTLPDDRIEIYHTGPLSVLEKKFISERDQSRYKRFHLTECEDSQIRVPLNDVVLFYSMQPTLPTEKTYHKILSEGISCNPVYYHDIFGEEIALMEIFSPNASKARAMEWLKFYTGADKVVAFGDNVNDIPILKTADLAVATGNALPEVKEIADIVIGDNDSDSVARFILENHNI